MERLTTNLNGTIYFAKGKYPPATLCAEMETNEVRECMKLLSSYEDTELTPEEIKDLKARLSYQEALADAWEGNANSGSDLAHKYRELLLAKRKELKSYKDAEEQGLLHKASISNGTPIFTLSSDEEIEFFGDEPLNETSYLYGYTEYVFGQMGERWFLTREAAEKALKGSISK